MFYYLKLASIKCLEYEEYINFFYVEKKCFSKEIYNKLRVNLNEKVRMPGDLIFFQEKTAIRNN